MIIVSDLFGPPGDLGIYNKLIQEIQVNTDLLLVQNTGLSLVNTEWLMCDVQASGVPEEQLWKSWHGDSHLIADDKRRWKELCPTFTQVVDTIRDYFDMDIKVIRSFKQDEVF